MTIQLLYIIVVTFEGTIESKYESSEMEHDKEYFSRIKTPVFYAYNAMKLVLTLMYFISFKYPVVVV